MFSIHIHDEPTFQTGKLSNRETTLKSKFYKFNNNEKKITCKTK